MNRTHSAKPEVVEAGGGVVFRVLHDEPEILLIHRRGVWDLPKGKLDPGETLVHCAAREVAEETAVGFPMVIKKLLKTTHYYEENSTPIEKQTGWYIMVTSQEQGEPQSEEQITELCWMPLRIAKERVGFDNLVLVLEEFEKCWKLQP